MLVPRPVSNMLHTINCVVSVQWIAASAPKSAGKWLLLPTHNIGRNVRMQHEIATPGCPSDEMLVKRSLGCEDSATLSPRVLGRHYSLPQFLSCSDFLLEHAEHPHNPPVPSSRDIATRIAVCPDRGVPVEERWSSPFVSGVLTPS